jgi:hypothetical protein
MLYKNAMVVDEQGFGVTNVLVHTDKILHYELNDGEYTVFENFETARSMVAPKWNDGIWIETGNTATVNAKGVDKQYK